MNQICNHDQNKSKESKNSGLKKIIFRLLLLAFVALVIFKGFFWFGEIFGQKKCMKFY
jgi:hypothetical protein